MSFEIRPMSAADWRNCWRDSVTDPDCSPWLRGVLESCIDGKNAHWMRLSVRWAVDGGRGDYLVRLPSLIGRQIADQFCARVGDRLYRLCGLGIGDAKVFFAGGSSPSYEDDGAGPCRALGGVRGPRVPWRGHRPRSHPHAHLHPRPLVPEGPRRRDPRALKDVRHPVSRGCPRTRRAPIMGTPWTPSVNTCSVMARSARWPSALRARRVRCLRWPVRPALDGRGRRRCMWRAHLRAALRTRAGRPASRDLDPRRPTSRAARIELGAAAAGGIRIAPSRSTARPRGLPPSIPGSKSRVEGLCPPHAPALTAARPTPGALPPGSNEGSAPAAPAMLTAIALRGYHCARVDGRRPGGSSADRALLCAGSPCDTGWRTSFNARGSRRRGPPAPARRG